MSDTDWAALDLAHHLHPFTDPIALARTGVTPIVRGAGVWVEDAAGNRYLDALAGLWNMALGYGRRELADAAHRQMLELPYYNAFFGTTNPPAAALTARLAEIAPSGLDTVSFASSGSEANDTAIRLARHYWALTGCPEKRVVIGRDWGFHGSTMATASAGGMLSMHRQGGLPLPDFAHVMAPRADLRLAHEDEAAFAKRAARAVAEKIVEIGPEHVAALIAEPVQGAGGAIVPPPGYWAEVQGICRAYDVLLIVDEVVCGFGRTGRWFGSQTFDIVPDIMTVAKALTAGHLPLSATLLGPRVAGALKSLGGELAHGFTNAGHPVACAVALEVLRILEDEGIVDRVRDDTGPYLQARLAALTDHPAVAAVEGVGLLGAVILEAQIGASVRDAALASGLIVRPVGERLILSPPLIVTRAEIDDLIARLTRALDIATGA